MSDSSAAPSTMKDPPAASLPATSSRSEVASLPSAATQGWGNVPLPILRAEANLSEKQILTAVDDNTNTSKDEPAVIRESVRLFEETLYADKNSKTEKAADNIDGSASSRHGSLSSQHQDPIPGPPEFRSAARIAVESRPGAFPVAGISATSDDLLSGGEENGSDQNIHERTEAQEWLEFNTANDFYNDEYPTEYPIEASVVDENDYEDASVHRPQVLEEATNVKPLPPTRPKKERSSKVGVFVIFLLLFVGILVAIVLISTLSQDHDKASDEIPSQEGQPAEIPMEEEITATYPPFDNGTLPLSTQTDILDNPGSPRYKANTWMWEDPLFESYLSWRQHQRFAMAVIYFSTEGDNWLRKDDWLSYEVPECQWFSQSDSPTVCDEDGRLVIQDYKYNNLGGTLPFEFQLASTKIADYSNNNISGYLPQLTDTNRLEEFIVSNNRIRPYAVVADSGLIGEYRKVIKIDSNNIEFKNMGLLSVFPSLEVLNMTKNVIASTLPMEVQLTPNLTYLGIGDNLCVGTVPTELGLLPALTGLDISDNLDLQGTLPTELGLLYSLVDLDVSNNEALNGTLPEELSALENLVHLDISGTSITGMVPMELCSRNNSGVLSLIANCSQLECC
ncbi:Leucine Rich Repeat [Seminavis robusta]|uniref:Leucine Rich Repeat n=1 Tax=Seminavis robusta TaxID=568900 RepID=A0A9N8DJY0_9STRA|nr:Leucine Rich Repeat [Seminavis robusta]|eukprot:Sro195_g083180.1 Leucine Rich Repeat (622) ;mRNA; f:44628-46493